MSENQNFREMSPTALRSRSVFRATATLLMGIFVCGCGVASDDADDTAQNSEQPAAVAGPAQPDADVATPESQDGDSGEQPLVQAKDQEKEAGPDNAQSTGGWVMDLAKLKAPKAPAAGKLHGKAFKPSQAKLVKGTLTIRQGEDFFADLEITLFLFDDAPFGKTIEVAADQGIGAGVPHVYMSWREKKDGIPESKPFLEKYVLKLRLDEAKDGKVAGSIYLCLPDEGKSFLAGDFSAELPKD